MTEIEPASLVVIRFEGQRHYLACVLELPPLDVVCVNRELANCDSQDILLFWLKKHGGLAGMTPAQAVQAGGRLERVAQIASAWAKERARPSG